MIRPPPRSPLFPYPTLSRSQRAELRRERAPAAHAREPENERQRLVAREAQGPAERAAAHGRSEEHTSELQSQSNLVCRLLLEKKKKNRKNKLATSIQPTM